MSTAATLPITHVEIQKHETAEVEVAVNGSMLPMPRMIPTASTLAFMLAASGSAIAAYLSSLALMYMMAYSVTLGAWALVTIFSIWAPAMLIAVLAASDRGEFG